MSARALVCGKCFLLDENVVVQRSGNLVFRCEKCGEEYHAGGFIVFADACEVREKGGETISGDVAINKFGAPALRA